MSKITLADVRSEAMDAIKKVKTGEMDTKTATTIKGLLDTVIDTAKTQIEFVKAMPDTIRNTMSSSEIYALAAPLQDPDAELDLSLKQIEENNRKPYQIQSK